VYKWPFRSQLIPNKIQAPPQQMILDKLMIIRIIYHLSTRSCDLNSRSNKRSS